MGKRNCAVSGCTNSSYHLDKWKKSVCDLHSDKTHEVCVCEQPFQLYCFPEPIRFHEQGERWIKLIQRVTKDNKLWKPCSSDRVCSEHFVDGIRTEKHPYTTFTMGYELPQKEKARRPLVTYPQPCAGKSDSDSNENMAALTQLPVTYAEEQKRTVSKSLCSVLQGYESEHSYAMRERKRPRESCEDKNSVILFLTKKIDVPTKGNDLLKKQCLLNQNRKPHSRTKA